MTKFGKTLEKFQDQQTFSFQQVNQIGLQLLDIFERFHSIGFVYNDLKSDNICVAIDDKDELNLKLIDFGLATSYLEEDTGNHISQTVQNIFKGNIIFASLNALNFNQTSRKDDLISLLYYLLSLADEKFIFQWDSHKSYRGNYDNNKFQKSTLSVKSICQRCDYLLQFGNLIDSLGFSSAPDYN